MPEYRQKPIEIEARQYQPDIDPDQAADVLSWCGADVEIDGDGQYVGTLGQQGGWSRVMTGDYVIKSPAGFTLVRPVVFEQLYEPISRETLVSRLTKRIGKFA
jgi:hypothetical protein